MTKIIKCNCKSDFQDERYGKSMRVYNVGEKSGKCTCTVCGNVIKQTPEKKDK